MIFFQTSGKGIGIKKLAAEEEYMGRPFGVGGLVSLKTEDDFAGFRCDVGSTYVKTSD